MLSSTFAPLLSDRARRSLLTALLALAFMLSSVGVLAPPAKAIVGGQLASEEYPNMAAFLYEGRQICGASLIAPQWIISAAHCVDELDPSHYSFRLGQHDLAEPGGETIQADQVIVHPDYDGDHDIALFHLAQPSTMTPIELAHPVEDRAQWEPGDIARVIGWGGQFFQLPSIDDQLREVDIPVVSDAECDRNYGPTFGGIDDTTEVCAGELHGTEDSCQGDSGGPLMVRDAQGEWVQMGVVSWGLGCALPTQYGVYARVGDTTLYDWIQQTIANTEPPPPPPPPPPTTTVTVEPQGYIAASAPTFGAGGVTETEFMATCSTDLVTQGVDGYAWALPPELAVDGAIAKLTGDSFFHDLDITFWDAECGFLDGSATGAADEEAEIPAGTAFVLAHNFLGADALVDLTVTLPETITTTSLELTGPTEGRYNGDVAFEARLTDDAGAPIADQPIRFAVANADGEQLQIAAGTPTDANGVSLVTMKLGVPAGDYTIEAAFIGQPDTLAESRVESAFTALTAETALDVAATGVGSKKEVTATLTELASGATIGGRSIQFFANCEAIGTGETSEDGTTTMSVPPRYRAATTLFSAVFEGDTGDERFYSGSRAGSEC